MFGDADAAVDSMGDAHSDVEEEEEESIMKEERERERQRKEGRKFSSAPPSVRRQSVPRAAARATARHFHRKRTLSSILARVLRRR